MQCYNITYADDFQMMDDTPVLSICTTCRDGREVVGERRGGARLAQEVLLRLQGRRAEDLTLRGVQCMSQCKRPCVASLSGHGRFTYVFGDLDPENADHINALLELVARYGTAPEGFLERRQRPEALRSNILGRFPPMASTSHLVTLLGTTPAA